MASACESKVFNIAYNVKLRDCFFAKGQPYSVLDMLGQDPFSFHFAGELSTKLSCQRYRITLSTHQSVE